MKKRETGLDLLRSVALIFVISVHYFLNNRFYYQDMDGFAMWGAGTFRWLFFTCVPLFLLITGYLRGEDRPTKRYYSGIFRVVISWLIISVISIFFWNYYDGMTHDLIGWVAYVLDFKAANYSWYVEMYIGLFLIIPYINLAFHSIETRKGHNLMVGTICGMIFLPSALNGWGIGDTTLNLIPNYWTSLYPFGYYLIGCYIRKYRPKLPVWFCLFMAAVLCLFYGTLTYVTANGEQFGDGLGGGYSDLCVCLTSVLIFLGLYRLPDLTEKGFIGRVTAKVLKFISLVSLDAYLISWIFDKYFYPKANPNIGPGNYFYYYAVICIPVIVLSILAAYPVSWVAGQISGLLKRLFRIR